jgi:ABC-2 type transport system permease protein
VSTAPALPSDSPQEAADPLATVIVPGTRPARASAPAASLAFAWRAILKIKHVPEQLLDVTVTPVLLLVMFTYIFGGAIAGSTSEYLQFILPGVLVMSVLFTTVYSGVSLNTDVTKGVVDRFRSLPIARPAPLVGAVLGDSVRYLVGAVVIVVLGVAMGYRPEAGASGLAAAVALVVVFSFGFSWVFTTAGMIVRTPNAVMNMGWMALFPLTFLSNVFVPLETLPGWLEWLVGINPVTHLVTATRGLTDGTAAAAEIGVVLAIAAALTLVFAPLTTLLYRRKD